MAKISALKLDPETRDLCFDADGIMEVVEDGNAIAQNIRNNLLTWKGEFPLNTGHGKEWQRVMGRPISEAHSVKLPSDIAGNHRTQLGRRVHRYTLRRFYRQNGGDSK